MGVVQTGDVERPRKVAIVGGGPTRVRAPYSNPNWEVWAFSSKLYRYPRVDRWFEIHHMTDLRKQLATKRPGRRSFAGYMRYMRRLKCPIYMMKPHPKIPNSLVFPKDQLVAEFGHCFTSTASFLIALAIMEEVDVIGLWGINPKGRRYNRQRPAIRYLLSVAKQKGIRVVVPRGFGIRIPKRTPFVHTPVLYAYDWTSRGAWWRRRVRRRSRVRRHRVAR